MSDRVFDIDKKLCVDMVKNDLRKVFEMSLDDRVNRYLEINNSGIIANTPFAEASSECIEVYRDGFYIVTVMMRHAINEGIVRYATERNGLKKNSGFQVWLDTMLKKKIVTTKFGEASRKIWHSY